MESALTRSRNIAIQTNPNQSVETEDWARTISMQNRYDLATWRMYEMIMNYRERDPVQYEQTTYHRVSISKPLLRTRQDSEIFQRSIQILKHKIENSCWYDERNELSDEDLLEGEIFELDL
jgi:hypothetical protein